MFRRMLAILSLCAALPSAANSFGTDITDLWWNANEGGWGVNVNHQNEVLFITFFVYGPNNTAIWYGASDMQYTGTTSNGQTFTGALFQGTGPWLGSTSFNANQVTYRQVGTATFVLNTVASATLTYSVDGTTVSKSLTRYSFRTNNIAGTYVGASIGTYSSCVPPFSNGYSEQSARILVSQNVTTISIQAVDAISVCTYTGPYSQNGRTGLASGSFSCTGGIFGTFQAVEIDGSPYGFTARAFTQGNVCNWTGRIGGLKTGS
jgi:hypothetical protein